MMEAILYSQPVANAIPQITHDNGTILYGEPGFDSNGYECLIVKIPPSIPPGQGATIAWEHPDYYIPPQHCKFVQETGGKWWLQHDVWQLIPKSSPNPPDPTPIPGENPLDIIMYVYESTLPNLSTKAGCGKFTEDVQKALSDSLSVLYGHIKKAPEQNQYNGHAVDAVMLLMNFGDVVAGIYDIIQSSVSPEAKPVFNYVEPPIPELWYNPTLENGSLVFRRTKHGF